MKLLGLIGGMSWESTALYYQLLNRMARERLGGQHSARLILWSVDFAPVAAKQAAGDWHALGAEMVDAARRLEDAGAEALLICANTMHLFAGEVEGAVRVPLVHIADATAAALNAAFVKRPLLLATRFTMEKPFWLDRLADRGVEALVPEADDRARLHAIIYDELVQGVFRPQSRRLLIDLVERERAARGVDGAILGCTEFGMLAPPGSFDLPAFDTAEIHARAAMDFALGA
jgi:aspartate racemase